MAQAAKRKTEQTFFTAAFSSFSVNDLRQAKEFYGETLGVDVEEMEEGLHLNFEGGSVSIYQKADHEPATFTVLNFNVDDIDETVALLTDRGVECESYTGEMETDDTGVYRGKESETGPDIAWFKDPAGNFISVIEG